MVSDNHNNESFNLIKYIILILISISIGLLIVTFHNREIIFASATGYSFGIIDEYNEMYQSDVYNGSLKDAFYYNLSESIINYISYKGYSTTYTREQLYSQFDTYLDSSNNQIFDTLLNLGFLPNVYISNRGDVMPYVYIIWSKVNSTGVLTFDINDNALIKFSSYPSLIGSIVISSNTYYDDISTSNDFFMSNRIYSFNTLNGSSLSDYPVYTYLGHLNTFLYSDQIYYQISSNKYVMCALCNDLRQRCETISWYSIILCSYPKYEIFKNTDIIGVNSYFSDSKCSITIPAYSTSDAISIGWNPRTQYFFNQYYVEPLYPTPTPVPTALPTITPTPLPLAFDSNIDGMEDGTTLGFLESLSNGFDTLISTFTVIPFFSISISYLYNYSPWFRLLFFVPIIAFLSFLIGRNKS